MSLLTGPQGQSHPQHSVSVLWRLLSALTLWPGSTTAEASCSGPLAASPRSSIASRGYSSTWGLLMHTPCCWNIVTRPSPSCQLGDHLSHARLEPPAKDPPELHGTPSLPPLGLSSTVTSSERSSLLDHSTQSSTSSFHTCFNFLSTLYHPTLTPAPREVPST